MARGRGEGVRIHSRLVIPWRELDLGAARSGGPGGQNVNKSATKVVLRFDVAGSEALGAWRRARLLERLGSRLTRGGEVVIHASRHRERARNVQDACERLAELLREGLRREKPRRKTRPTRSSVRRRLEAKRRTGERKRARRPPERE